MIALGLVAGLALGIAASVTGSPFLDQVAAGIEPAGTIWMNLVRMCVIPMVVFALISGVANLGDVRRLGRVGARTFGWFFGTIALSAVAGLIMALLLAPLAPVSEATAASLRETAAAGAGQVTAQVQQIRGIKEFLLNLVPANPVKAAADGALLPLIVFSVLFGAAVGALEEERRTPLLKFADAATFATIKLVGWVMLLGPIGVFCLVAPLSARIGLDALRSLAVFVLAVCLTCTLLAFALFLPLARALTGLRTAPFLRNITPGIAVAFTTATSMAALPAMMDSALNRLGMSRAVAGFVLPVGATLNRPGSAVYQVTAVVFVAALYGVDLGPAQYIAAIATSFLMTFSVAAIPSATVFTTAPVFVAAGLPVEAIALLLGVDRLPDMFRTGLHAVSHQSVAAIVARAEGEELR